MKIVLIASNYYPILDVSSIRIHSYCKALAELGIDITVLIVYPLKDHPKDIVKRFEGVKYKFLMDWDEYICGKAKKWNKRIKGLKKIKNFVDNNKVDVILSYHDNFLTNIFIKSFVSTEKIPYIIDKTEYPYGYADMNLIKRIYTNLCLKFFDGFIVISDELRTFYKKFSNHVFLLPMTIDPNRFDETRDRSEYDKYLPFIALTFGTHGRDGLFDSIKAYHKYTFLSQSRCMNLLLIGDFDGLVDKFPITKSIAEYIESNKLFRKIIFVGKKPISEVPSILIKATCLITTASEYNSGGFPTKLGEYMLSGVPIVATNAGEISNYLQNNKDLFLCPVNDIDCVANRILYIQNHPNEAKVIASNALETAKTKFNAKTYVNSLLNFINNVKNDK